jgi:hypothetical protein
MFSPGRILLVAALAAVVYFGWFAAPAGPRAEGEFDPETVAASEVAAWQALQGREDFSVYFNVMQMLREQHRYTWFKAAEAGFALGRATNTFVNLHGHYDRVLPDLTDAAAIQKDWGAASYDPAAVAKAQLTWWVARRLPNQNSLDDVSRLIAEEYALRYEISPEQASDAALRRAEAVQLLDSGGIDPDWRTIQKDLEDSYRALHGAIQLARTVKLQRER